MGYTPGKELDLGCPTKKNSTSSLLPGIKELEWGCSRNLGPWLLPCVLLVRALGFKEANCTNLAIILSLISPNVLLTATQDLNFEHWSLRLDLLTGCRNCGAFCIPIR
jgi:hypothetical protein